VIGFEAEIQAVLVPATECAVLDFYNSFGNSHKLAPQLQIDTPFLQNGQPLKGSVTGVEGRNIEALIVGDDGITQNVSAALPTGRSGPFSLAVARKKSPGQPQLLLLISSAEPLSALKLAKPARSAQVFPAAAAEAEQKQEDIGVAIRYFYLIE
jgi:hypothetical protein